MIPKRLKEIVEYVADYAAETTNDWFTIKRELVNTFPPKDRSRFSRRHYSTKKHIISDFDLEVIKYWEQITGQKLIINQDKLHPATWEQKPKGWGLRNINEQRQKDKKS